MISNDQQRLIISACFNIYWYAGTFLIISKLVEPRNMYIV